MYDTLGSPGRNDCHTSKGEERQTASANCGTTVAVFCYTVVWFRTDFCTTKVAQLHFMSLRIEQQILRLDVTLRQRSKTQENETCQMSDVNERSRLQMQIRTVYADSVLMG